MFDHRNRQFFITNSDRANPEAIQELVARWNEICVDGDSNPYRAVTFKSYDQRDDLIYHTDCLFTLHANHALVCLDAIRSPNDRRRVVEALTEGEHKYEILDLSLQQIEHMTANA